MEVSRLCISHKSQLSQRFHILFLIYISFPFVDIIIILFRSIDSLLTVKQEKQHDILHRMEQEKFNDNEMFAFLKVLLHILMRKTIIDINTNVLNNILNIINKHIPSVLLITALAVISQILNMRSKTYDNAKQLVSISVTIFLGIFLFPPFPFRALR